MIDLNQISEWAAEAIAQAAKEADTTLDYSRESIGALERVLLQVRQGLGDDTWDLACRFGAYFGEVMLRNDFAALGYEWAEDYDGEPCLVATTPQEGASLDKVLPITKVNKFLLSGIDESVAKLYASCLSMLKGGDVMTNLASLGVDPSQIPGVEPVYVNKGKFDANAAAWLFYGDYIFFRQQEIVWDGTTHRPVGMQVNAAKMRDIPTIVNNTSMLNGVLDLLMELEKDEGLRVPLSMIHPGLHDALRNEDLTGITFFNLMACAQALIIKEPSPDDYQVMCDNRLPMGIPSFYQLVARMIWGMRAYNDRSGSYKVTFLNARNLDADVVLDEVDRMVPGAFSQPIWQVEVTEKPRVELPSQEEVQAFVREASRVFASGFEDPLDIQADEDLFEATLNQLAAEFPITQDIEGTHHMGRIPRIEHVKVGDSLVLAADWQSEFFDPVCIEVFNAAGETLGNLRERFSPTLSGNRELACLLPHITATVETVTPKSKRRRNAKYALMDVRMAIDPAVVGPDGNLLPEVIRDAKALLTLPRGERVVVSKGSVVASQLAGNIKVDEAHDVPNPVGETFHLWEIELDGEVAEEPSQQASAPVQVAAQPVASTQTAPQQAFDTGRWTFDQHHRVQARRFSIEVPDQWVPTPDEGGRPLARYVEGVEDESEYPEILCNSMLGDLDDEAQETMRNALIPEVRLQMQRKAMYSNDMTNKIMRIVNDWVVEGKNCQVLVFECLQPSIFPDMFPDSYEYHVKPIAYDHEDFLRLADSWDHLNPGDLKALAFGLAQTMELDKPVELRRPAELEAYSEGPADADAFCETVGVVANMLNMSGSDRMNANLYRAVRQAGNEMQVLLMGDTMPLIQAEAFNEGLDDEVAYFGRIVQALEKQAELGTDGFDKMWKLAGEFGDGRIVDHVTMDDNKESETKINALGVIKIPEGYAALHERWEALRPGPDGKPKKPVVTADTHEGEADAEAPEVTVGEAEQLTSLAPESEYAARLNARIEAQAEAKRQADELEREAAQGQEAELNREYEGLLEDVAPLPEDFVLDYGKKDGEPFASRGRAERMQETIESTLTERERVEAEWHTVRTRLVCALQAMINKRAAEEKRASAASRAVDDRQQRSVDFADQVLAERRRQAEEGTRLDKESPQEKSERINRDNAQREDKLEQLRKKWAEEAAARERKEMAATRVAAEPVAEAPRIESRQQKSVDFADSVLAEHQKVGLDERYQRLHDKEASASTTSASTSGLTSTAHQRRMDLATKKWAEEAAARERLQSTTTRSSTTASTRPATKKKPMANQTASPSSAGAAAGCAVVVFWCICFGLAFIFSWGDAGTAAVVATIAVVAGAMGLKK